MSATVKNPGFLFLSFHLTGSISSIVLAFPGWRSFSLIGTGEQNGVCVFSSLCVTFLTSRDHVCVPARSVLSVVSDSLWSQGLYLSRLHCAWNFPGKATVSSCHAVLQGIFPTQESNPSPLHLLHCRGSLYWWAVGEAPLSSIAEPFFPFLSVTILFCCSPSTVKFIEIMFFINFSIFLVLMLLTLSFHVQAILLLLLIKGLLLLLFYLTHHWVFIWSFLFFYCIVIFIIQSDFRFGNTFSSFIFKKILATPQGMRNLSSSTRNRTHALWWKHEVLTPGPPAKSFPSSFTQRMKYF